MSTRNCLKVILSVGVLSGLAGVAGVLLPHRAPCPPDGAVLLGSACAEEAAGQPGPIAAPFKFPAIPRHYPHIRIAALAYDPFRFTAFEDRLLRESVDLVIPHRTYLQHIHEVAPSTPQLIYTNTSNLYLELLQDWLTYADTEGLSREDAFYHARRPVAFRGGSPSSKPVTWFWAVYRGDQSLMDFTSAACGRSPRSVRLGSVGESVYLGYPDRFREINLDVAGPAGDGWSAVLEYVTSVGRDGGPSTWAPLKISTDSTAQMTRSGQVTFDPPADWKTMSINRSGWLYFVRVRTIADGTAPSLKTILGRDFVNARGTAAGTVPVFDSEADTNHDGYLDDTEYAKRAPGKDARFVCESRMVTSNYGQMRLSTNPASAGFRKWAVAYHLQFSKKQPLANGFFLDNVDATAPVKPVDVIESVDNYPQEAGKLVHAVAGALAPRWVLMNIGNQGPRADPLLRANPRYFAEFAIRPLFHHYEFFEDLVKTVAHYAALTRPAPLAVLDSYPRGGSPTDARTQLATLAYYFMLADPEYTFLMFYGGSEPSTPWVRHWCPATAYDVGKPAGQWSRWATGTDPSNAALQYRVYQRPYTKALVLYKPLSFGGWRTPPPNAADATATTHQLQTAYQPLQADGTLGKAVTSITLRNGEGAILVKAAK